VKTKVIAEGTERVFALILEKGEEVIAGLTSFAKDQNLKASHFTAIGAFEDVTLGYFDREWKNYKRIPFKEQFEVLVLAGDIALRDLQPQVHAHVVLGRSDGTTCGGHLLGAHVWPTLEVVLHESPDYLKRIPDKETGLALIDLSS
jgi:uncharacterized protein